MDKTDQIQTILRKCIILFGKRYIFPLLKTRKFGYNTPVTRIMERNAMGGLS